MAALRSDQGGRGRSRARWIESAESRSSSRPCCSLGASPPLPCPAPGPTAGDVTPAPPGRRRPRGHEAEARAARADRTALTAPCRSVAGRDARRSRRLGRRIFAFRTISPLPFNCRADRLATATPAADPAVRAIQTTNPSTPPPSSASASRHPRRPLLEAQARAAGAHRLGLPDQPRHRLATLRRPAVDRSRRAGQCLGGGSTAHAGQGPLGPYIDVWRRLCPARRRRPGF